MYWGFIVSATVRREGSFYTFISIDWKRNVFRYKSYTAAELPVLFGLGFIFCDHQVSHTWRSNDHLNAAISAKSQHRSWLLKKKWKNWQNDRKKLYIRINFYKNQCKHWICERVKFHAWFKKRYENRPQSSIIRCWSTTMMLMIIYLLWNRHRGSNVRKQQQKNCYRAVTLWAIRHRARSEYLIRKTGQ